MRPSGKIESKAPGSVIGYVPDHRLAVRDGGLDIEAICGGQCICSTCHVYIDPEWAASLPARGDAEQVLVEDSGHFREESRLSCQVEYEAALDGLKLELAPEF